ncbi:MAG: exodeoxyribonuclease VII small subunit [Peptococcaceae bacterium]|nr:exodeoxyribonuclease VII small subunit [Peptococcaceae bacterium]
MSEVKNQLSFEQAMAQLEEALKVLSQGDIPLEKAVEQYKIGLDMASLCQNMLRNAEGEIKVLQNGVEQVFQMEDQQ